MLRELSVRNLALIEDVRVELGPGFAAWTGETGAGKSLLLGALGFLLGERGSTDLIRAGEDELRVVGVFTLARAELRDAVAELLDEPVGEELLLMRRLSREGGSKNYVNDRPVTAAALKRIGQALADIHGQRENHSLLQPAVQLALLDAFGKLATARTEYQARADALRSLRLRYRDLHTAAESRERERSQMRLEREELDAAQLKPGELTALILERDRLLHAQALQKYTSRAANRLYEADDSVVAMLGKVVRDGQPWLRFDPRIGEVVPRMEAALSELRDAADTLRDLAEGYEADPPRLEEVERRLQLLKRLEAKYEKPLDALMLHHAALDDRERTLRAAAESSETLHSEIAAAYAAVQSAALTLSKGRAKVAKKLATQTQEHLASLGMPAAQLTAALESIPWTGDALTAELPADGVEKLELMLAANPGEPARPLRKVASGGELSRTMLALQCVLAEHDPVGTLIFDEIDANVGGRLGDVLGKKLALLGRTHQVICVTHLPQVAGYAQTHWTIRKQTRGKRTTTTITPLTTEEARLEELAEMLRGDAKEATTLREAAAMLEAARKNLR